MSITPLPARSELPPAHTARPPVIADVPEIFALISEYDLQYLPRPDAGEDDIRADLEDRLVDLEHGAWVVHDGGSTLVGYAVSWWDAEHAELTFDPYVRPGADPALWDWLLGQCFGRAADLRAQAGRDITIEGGCYTQDPAWSARLATSGMAAVRRFWRMTIALDPGAPHAPPALADGVVIRPVDVDDETDLRRMHHVMDDSFSEHFGAHRRDFDTWWTDARNGSGYDPSQWWIALVDGAEAGGLMGTTRLADAGFGYVRGLGTLAGYRGRGLAKALLITAFGAYAERGLTGAELGVDSENATGATRLYESVGMSVDATIEIWRGTVTTDGVVAVASP